MLLSIRQYAVPRAGRPDASRSRPLIFPRTLRATTGLEGRRMRLSPRYLFDEVLYDLGSTAEDPTPAHGASAVECRGAGHDLGEHRV